MSMFTGTPTTVITVYYRPSLFSKDDIQRLHSEFRSLGSVRTKGLTYPMTQGNDMWALIEFIGQSAAAAIVGQLAINFFGKLAEVLRRLRKEQQNSRSMGFETFSLVYDDLEIRPGMLTEDVIANLPMIAAQVEELLTIYPDEPIHQIGFPVDISVREFQIGGFNSAFSMPKNPSRYWLLTTKDMSGVPRIYDTQRKLVVDVSRVSISSTIRSREDLDSFIDALFENESLRRRTRDREQGK